MTKTTWIITRDGDRIPTIVCAACGTQISEYKSAVQRGATGQPNVNICDTVECWQQWNRR